MDTSYKPAGYTSVAPYLVVDGAAGTIQFLEKVFGAEHLRSFPGPAGKLMHAEVRIDDTVVMLADGGHSSPPIPAHVHVYVPDVDAIYRRAIEAGATPVQEPVKKDDPDKRGAFRDPGGTTWWVGTKVE
jgi:PhnB protein